MRYSLTCLKGGLYSGDYIGDHLGVIQPDTRSLDNGSYNPYHFL